MATLNDLFTVIKFSPFIKEYTSLDESNGIRSRKNGKGTRPGDKQTTFRDEEKAGIREGLEKLVTDIHQVINEELS